MHPLNTRTLTFCLILISNIYSHSDCLLMPCFFPFTKWATLHCRIVLPLRAKHLARGCGAGPLILRDEFDRWCQTLQSELKMQQSWRYGSYLQCVQTYQAVMLEFGWAAKLWLSHQYYCPLATCVKEPLLPFYFLWQVCVVICSWILCIPMFDYI